LASVKLSPLSEEVLKRGKRGRLARIAAAALPAVSEAFCALIPDCTSGTVSAEVAKRANTTIQGAHALMLAPLLALLPVAEDSVVWTIVVSEATEGFRLQGPRGVTEVLRFIPEVPGTAKLRKRLERLRRRKR